VTLQLDATLRSLRIQLEQLEHVLQLNTQQIESATKKTREELRLYSQGRGQLTFVIASRDDVQRAKLNYARNAGAYQQLLLRYREVVDQLLPADGDAHGGRR
jgi:TolA-binding protein